MIDFYMSTHSSLTAKIVKQRKNVFIGLATDFGLAEPFTNKILP